MAKKRNRAMPKSWADPKAAQTAQLAEHSRGGTFWLVAGFIAILLLAIIGIVLFLNSTSSRVGQDARIDGEVSALLTGIPQEGRTLGSRMAPVTLQVFADLEDEDSRRWTLTLLPEIVRLFVRPGILKIEYRSYKTNTINPETFVKQQAAAVAAGAQGVLWNFIDTFYREQGREYTHYVTESFIDNIASQVQGLNIALWHKDRNDGRRTEQVVTDDQQGRADGLHVTPSYRIGRTGGQLKNLVGSEAITFSHQRYPTTFVSAQDIANVLRQIH